MKHNESSANIAISEFSATGGGSFTSRRNGRIPDLTSIHEKEPPPGLVAVSQYNNIVDSINDLKATTCADDTVIYYSNSDVNLVIEEVLNVEIERRKSSSEKQKKLTSLEIRAKSIIHSENVPN